MERMKAFLRSKTVWSLLAAVALVALAPRLQRELAGDRRFWADPAQLEIHAPAWGGRPVVEPAIRALRALGTISLFDDAFEERIATALRAYPGIASVDAVQRIWPRRYAVDVTLRRPYAVVAQGARRVPVTTEGIVLPEGPYAEVSRGLLEIVGVPGQPPAPGSAWRDPRLVEGLGALVQIAPHLEELAPLRIETVDVARADNPMFGVLLRGAEGVTVRWGRPSAKVAENSVAAKVEMLREAALSPAKARGYELDVRFGALRVAQSGTP